MVGLLLSVPTNLKSGTSFGFEERKEIVGSSTGKWWDLSLRKLVKSTYSNLSAFSPVQCLISSQGKEGRFPGDKVSHFLQNHISRKHISEVVW